METTPLHGSHKALGAKMAEFAGYDMPIQYSEGVMAEHEWTRSHCGLFDVSHMGQIMVTGKGVMDFFEKVTPSSFGNAPDGRAKYTVLPNNDGGIIDDLIVTRLAEDRFFAVLNAGCKDKDMAWLKENLPEGLDFEYLEDRALVAVQGQTAEKVMKDVFNIGLSDMPYMWMRGEKLPCGTDIFVSRVGYTGEDGFELSVPAGKAAEVWDALLGHAEVKPVGLAARDSLRLDMGYCLYGHDIDDKTTPIEAGLRWVIGKDNVDFIGAGIIRAQMEDGASQMRVGVKLTDKGIAREGAELRNEKDEVIGTLTSGGFSPSMKMAVGQGYVPSQYAKSGTKIFVNVRGRNIEAEIADMPFIPAKTKSMKSNNKQAA